MGHYSSFIIRLWVDPPEGFRWGLVQHVGSQAEQRFNTLQDMLDFMVQHAEAAEISIPFSLNSSAILPSQDTSAISAGENIPASSTRADKKKGQSSGLDAGGA